MGENESAVQAALSQLLRGKTVLVIAHRMRTVAGADQIVVLEEGRVAQKGPPQELMEQGGLYRYMVELLLTGVDGNLGSQAAEYLLELEPAENLIFCGYSEEALKKYAERGVETRVTNFNFSEGLKEAFTGAERLALISMPFVGAKRQNAHKNVVDAAKAAGVKQVIYTSLVNAGDETNPSVEKKDHIYTENLYQGFRPGLHLPAELPVRRGHDYQLLHLCKAGRRAEEQPGRRQDGLHLPKGLRQGGGLRPAPGRRV